MPSHGTDGEPHADGRKNKTVFRSLHKHSSTIKEASFSRGSRKSSSRDSQASKGLEVNGQGEQVRKERRISRKGRNKLLGIAFGCLILDAVCAAAFCLMAPADPRLRDVYASRRQMRTVEVQGVVALIDAIVSVGIVVHVIAGILSASLDSFLEAAATKLLQAIFFSLLQTGYPTVLRLSFITVLLLLRVTAAALIFRAAFLSGVLMMQPSRDLPKVVVSLLEMGAPVPNPRCDAASLWLKYFKILDRPFIFVCTVRILGVKMRHCMHLNGR